MARIKHKAFTLIELLIVFAVIGLLAGVILASVKSVRERASINKTLVYSKSVDNLLAADAAGIWNFDEGSGTTAKDTSGWTNHGTINGAAFTTDTPHKAAGAGAGKYALSFDGSNDYVNCGNQSSLNLTSMGSIGLWVKTNRTYPSDDATTKFRGIISKTNGGGGGDMAYFLDWYGTNSSRKLRAKIGDASLFIGYEINDFNFGSDWNYLVFVWDGSYLRLYINGVAQAPIAQSINVQIIAAPLRIGAAFADCCYQWDGLIDEVRVFSRALTQAEIRKLYAEGLENYSNFVSK